MASKKNIIEELKKYNKDLDKHFSDLDFEFLKELQFVESSGLSNDSEMYTLLGKYLMDIRTEMALMRKNTAVDIEGMVMRVIQEQQNRFEKRMNDFYSKAILEVKESFDYSIKSVFDELVEVKKDLNQQKDENKFHLENLKDILAQLSAYKTKLEKLDKLDTFSSHDSKSDPFMKAELVSEIDKIISSSINSVIENNRVLDSTYRKEIHDVKTQVLSLRKFIEISNERNESLLDRKIKENNNFILHRQLEDKSLKDGFKKDVDSFVSSVKNLENSQSILTSDDIVEVYDDSSSSVEIITSPKDSYYSGQKIIDIEQKLAKLSSLR